MDLNTGKILWDTPLPSISFAAATVVNDLLFTATYDGVIYALARTDGHIVWTFQAPGGIIAWPAVAADTMVWPVGLGRQPVLLALRLDSPGGTIPPAARPYPRRRQLSNIYACRKEERVSSRTKMQRNLTPTPSPLWRGSGGKVCPWPHCPATRRL